MSEPPTQGFLDAGPTERLRPGEGVSVRIADVNVLLCQNDDGGVLAVEDLCPHALQSLNGGRVRKGTILCPRHGARFDLQTGRPVNGVTAQSLRPLEARCVDGRVWVRLIAKI